MKTLVILLIITFSNTMYSQSTFVKSYNLSTSSSASTAIQTNDGNYLLTGGVNTSFVPSRSRIFLLKLDHQGEIIWLQTYDANGYEYGYDIQQTTDNGFVIVGKSYIDTINGYDLCLLKVQSNGIISWRKTYDFFKYDRGLSVKQTDDDGYVIAGECGNDFSQ